MQYKSNTLVNKQQYPCADVIKYICALLVIAIHIPPFSTYSAQYNFAPYFDYGIRNYVARIAVPFYFATAGFFLFRKIELDKFNISVTENYTLKLLRLLGIWTVLLIVGYKGHLWYMSGLIVAVCILSFLLYKKIDLKKILVIAIILYLFGLIGDSYYGLIVPLFKFKFIDYPIKLYFQLFSTTRNGLFFGFPFLFLGGIIEKKRIKLKPLYAFIGFILSMSLLFIEVILVWKFNLSRRDDVDLYLFLLPSVFFLLVFSVSIKMKPKEFYKKLRNVGVIVYFSHMIVFCGISWCFETIDNFLGIKICNSIINYLLTIIISTILGFVIEKLSHKKNLSFLKYLYS